MQRKRRAERRLNMDPEVIAALAFFGAVVIIPIVFMLQKHQRTMAEILHRGGSDELQHRIAALEREVYSLRVAQNELAIRADDRKELSSGND